MGGNSGAICKTLSRGSPPLSLLAPEQLSSSTGAVFSTHGADGELQFAQPAGGVVSSGDPAYALPWLRQAQDTDAQFIAATELLPAYTTADAAGGAGMDTHREPPVASADSIHDAGKNRHADGRPQNRQVLRSLRTQLPLVS
eukprot:COSAG02_NODE_5892_length_3956_cov_16.131190_4_plen_142_part_00